MSHEPPIGPFSLHFNQWYQLLLVPIAILNSPRLFKHLSFSESTLIIFVRFLFILCKIEKILKKITSLNLLSKFGVIAIERDGKAKPFTWPPSLTELKVRSYGAGSIHYGVQTERDA
jgi:hypothetical protein